MQIRDTLVKLRSNEIAPMNFEKVMDFRDRRTRTLDVVERVLVEYAPCTTHHCPGPDAGRDIELKSCWRCHTIQAVRRTIEANS